MSHYVTPFLVLNLGSEMVFVISQRLEAQNISAEKTALVMEEIISVLVSKQLITEIMKPQAAYSHEAVREIIEDVTQSSVMRLDPISMNKLWELITMVFKWQVTLTPNLINLTLRHLYEIETYITNPDTQLQIHKVQTLVENFNKILTPSDKHTLHEDIKYWLKDYNIRVSLLLRMGLQSADGLFVVNNLDPIAEAMLRNLGENIYSVTQNGKILENKVSKKEQNVNELQLFVTEIMGDRKMSSGTADGSSLKLSITEDCGASDRNVNNNHSNTSFDDIDVNVNDNDLKNLLHDLKIRDDVEESSFKEDLLDMITSEQ